MCNSCVYGSKYLPRVVRHQGINFISDRLELMNKKNALSPREKCWIKNAEQYDETMLRAIIRMMKFFMNSEDSPPEELKNELKKLLVCCKDQGVNVNELRFVLPGQELPLLSFVLSVKNPHLLSKTRIFLTDFLLTQSLDPNEVDASGWSALHHSIKLCSAPLLKALNAAGANMDAQTKNGWGAIHFAISVATPSFLMTLCLEGVDPLLKDNDGFTAKMFAAERQMTESKEALEILEVKFEKKKLEEIVNAVVAEKGYTHEAGKSSGQKQRL